MDLMLHGTVDYGLTNGQSVSVDWAAHAQLEDSASNLKMKYYRVYVDSAPVAAAAAAGSSTSDNTTSAPASTGHGHKRGMSSIDMAKLGGGTLYKEAMEKMQSGSK